MSNNNPADREIQRLLTESGAKLIRNTNHLVYELPNGNKFTMAKTPGGAQSTQNALHDLRRQLGVRHLSTTELPSVVIDHLDERLSEQDLSKTEVRIPEPENRQPVLYIPPVVQRLEAAIQEQERLREFHLDESTKAEATINLLNDMKIHMDTSDKVARMEIVLQTLLPPPPAVVKPATEPRRPAEPPQAIVDRVQITEQLVYAATTVLSEHFVINDIFDLMVKDRTVDSHERRRIRTSIADALMRLLSKGQVSRVAEGAGRRQAVFTNRVQTRQRETRETRESNYATE